MSLAVNFHYIRNLYGHTVLFSAIKRGGEKCGFHNSAKLNLTDFQINKWQLQSPPGDPSGGAKRICRKKRHIGVALLAFATVPLTLRSSLTTQAWMDDYNPVYRHCD